MNLSFLIIVCFNSLFEKLLFFSKKSFVICRSNHSVDESIDTSNRYLNSTIDRNSNLNNSTPPLPSIHNIQLFFYLFYQQPF